MEYSLPSGEKTSRAYDIEIAKLKKENAELREIIEVLQDNLDMVKFDFKEFKKYVYGKN